MKSKGTAYLIWFFLGIVGGHRFYLGKIGTGILYLCTFGFLGIGWLIDLFTLGTQVDTYNVLHGNQGQSQQQTQNVIVNIPPNPAPSADASGSANSSKANAEKIIMRLSEETPLLTFREILNKTELEFDQADSAMKKLVARGIAKEITAPEGGQVMYSFKD